MARDKFYFFIYILLIYSFVGTTAETSCAPHEVLWYGTCVPCPAGYFFYNQTCEKCPATSISSAGASECTPCPQNSQPDSKQQNCVCDSGFYSTDIMPDHDQGVLHPIGVHYEEQIVHGNTNSSCKLCTVGFCPENTFLDGGVCKNCPDGSISKIMSHNITDCKCLSGELRYYSGMGASCEPCASETFYNGGGLSSCTGCVAPKMSLLNCIGSYDDCCVDTQVFPCPIGTLPRDRGGSKCSSIGLRTDTEQTEDEFGRILPMKRLEDGTLENQRSLQNGYNVDDFTWKHSGYPLRKISKGEYSLCAQSLVTGNTFAVNRDQNVNLTLGWNWQNDLVHKAVDGNALLVVDFDCRWSTTENQANTFLAVPDDFGLLGPHSADIYIFPHYLNGGNITDWTTNGDYNIQVVSGLDFVCYSMVQTEEVYMKCHGENNSLPSSGIRIQSNTSTLISGPKDVCYWDSRLVRCWGNKWDTDGTTVFQHPETSTGKIEQVTVHYNTDTNHTAVCVLYGADTIQCFARGISLNSYLSQGTPFLYEKKLSAISTANDPRKICIEVDRRNYECYNVFSLQELTILGIRGVSDETAFNSQLDTWKNQNARFVQRLIAANPIIHLNPSLAHENSLDAGHSLSPPVFMRPYSSQQFTISQESLSELSMNEREAFFDGDRCPYLNHYCNKTRTATAVEFDGNWTVGGAGHSHAANNETNSDMALWVFVLRTLNSGTRYGTVMQLGMLDSTLETQQGRTRLVSPGRTLRNPDTSLSTGVLDHNMLSEHVKTVVMVKILKNELTQVRIVVQGMLEATFTLPHDPSHYRFPSLPDATNSLHVKQILYYESPHSIDRAWQLNGTSFEDTFEDLSEKVIVTNDSFVFVPEG